MVSGLQDAPVDRRSESTAHAFKPLCFSGNVCRLTSTLLFFSSGAEEEEEEGGTEMMQRNSIFPFILVGREVVRKWHRESVHTRHTPNWLQPTSTSSVHSITLRMHTPTQSLSSWFPPTHPLSILSKSNECVIHPSFTSAHPARCHTNPPFLALCSLLHGHGFMKRIISSSCTSDWYDRTVVPWMMLFSFVSHFNRLLMCLVSLGLYPGLDQSNGNWSRVFRGWCKGGCGPWQPGVLFSCLEKETKGHSHGNALCRHLFQHRVV